MTALEKIALDKLKWELYDALKRCSKENDGRMEHERLFIEGNVKRSLEIVKAIENHSTNQP